MLPLLEFAVEDKLVFLGMNRLAMHEESSSRRKVDDNATEGAIPAFLMDRDTTTRAKVRFSRKAIKFKAIFFSPFVLLFADQRYFFS